MTALITRLARDAAAPIGQMGERLLKMATLLFVAMCCLFFASVFLTIALYTFIQTFEGTAIAALGVGALYVGVGLICIILALRSSAPPGSAASVAAAPVETDEKRPEPSPEFATNIDGTIAPILDILRDGGFERERLAVEAGATIAKQLNPFSVVAFATVAGFMLGRVLGRRDPPGDAAA
ncbi:phage holin family protein [Methylocapsa polymorpha]|uniref:Phage holin family protein n=1 Tax=Methylocapsa polymorpha TaxID=3080828 RepID=A0ABZ0HRI1_9HYPH|nr:phage holin family protein [Methylocapsa sp. RX1]